MMQKNELKEELKLLESELSKDSSIYEDYEKQRQIKKRN